jgi:hypothetical protein
MHMPVDKEKPHTANIRKGLPVCRAVIQVTQMIFKLEQIFIAVTIKIVDI